MEKNEITPKEPWISRQAVKPTTAIEETGSFILEERKVEKEKENKRRETGQEIKKSKEYRVSEHMVNLEKMFARSMTKA